MKQVKDLRTGSEMFVTDLEAARNKFFEVIENVLVKTEDAVDAIEDVLEETFDIDVDLNQNDK